MSDWTSCPCCDGDGGMTSGSYPDHEVRGGQYRATPAPLDGLPGLIAIHRAWHENPRYDIALDTPCPLAPLDEFECPGCGGRWRYQTRPDGSKAVEHLATPAPLDVDRLARALRTWGGPGHSYWRVPAWPMERTEEAAAAIAAAYAEEPK